MEKDISLTNEIGCREDLPPPALRGNQRIDQRPPDEECGQSAACWLQAFIHTWKPQVEAVAAGLEALPASSKDKDSKDKETVARIDGLRHLLATAPGASFKGKKCHRCGDALICLEAPPGYIIATKNRKHFEPLAQILSKPLTVAETARSTTQGVPPVCNKWAGDSPERIEERRQDGTGIEHDDRRQKQQQNNQRRQPPLLLLPQELQKFFAKLPHWKASSYSPQRWAQKKYFARRRSRVGAATSG